MKNNQPTPSEAEQQWLKDLFEAAATPPPKPDPKTEEEEQWLKELFASAELAAEQEFAPEEPEDDPDADFALTDWPEALVAAPPPAVEIGPDEEAIAAAGLTTHPDGTEDPIPASDDSSQDTGEEAAEQEPAEAQPETADEPTPAAAPPTKVDSPVPAQSPVSGDAMIYVPDPEPTETNKTDEAEPAEDEAGEETKRRPKNKDGYGLFGIPHILVTGVWLAIILTFGVFFGQWLWRGASDVLAFDREEKTVTITITESDDLESLIDKLHSAGLINEPMWFRWYGQLTDVMEDIGTGTYELSTLFDYRALVTHMSPNSIARVTVSVRIPEGFSCAQVFALLEEKGVCSADALASASMSGDFSGYWFMEGVSFDDPYCLEGYLFPDTYQFYIGDNPSRVLNTLLSNFEKRFTDIMMAKLDVLNDKMAEKMRENGMSESEIKVRQFTIREVVVIASLIEKEIISTSEGYSFSSMIYNQLTHPTKHPNLEMQRPLMYITGRTDLTEADFALDSPYNTFLNPGLIPTPICNPSRTSLDAALDPTETDYYYFAYDPATNSHRFFSSESQWRKFLDSLEEEQP